MSNRRRSDRFEITLPVWLKDGRGGERTSTYDVSAHGIAVLASHIRPLRQYVELEISLDDPEAVISVTAVVARHAELYKPDGTKIAGLGLDFFLFDAQAKAGWQHFIRRLHDRSVSTERRPAAPLAPPPPPAPAAEDDETPTFIIKPRDLGRLWAFFRGEMARGMVRIETPVLKPVGHAAELLVVHPNSQAEWALEGKVARATEHGRGGRPVLEIQLDALDPETKATFRNFVATGRGQVEEDVSLSIDSDEFDADAADEEPQLATDIHQSARLQAQAPLTPSVGAPAGEESDRIESVVIDLDHLDAFEEAVPSGLLPAPPRFVTHPPDETPSGMVAAAPDEAGEDDDPTQHTRSPLPPGFMEEPPAAPRGPPPLPVQDPSSRQTSLFSSFFDEARKADPEAVEELESTDDDSASWSIPEITAEAEVDLSAASRARSTNAGGPASTVEPDDEEDAEPIPLVHRIRREPPPPPPAARPPPLPPSARLRSSPQNLAAAIRPAASRRRPSDDPSVQVRPVEPGPGLDAAMPVITGRRATDEAAAARVASGAGAGMAQNPPVPPGSVFDFGEPSQPGLPPRGPSGPVAVPTPTSKAPQARAPSHAPLSPAARRAARRSPVEAPDKAPHRIFSTESANPTLDRDIALARARVVRSPHSVTACYRLSSLLVQRDENGGFQEAVKALEKVMALEPNHPGAHHKLAELHARQGHYSKAAEHLSRARRLGYQVDPDLALIISSGQRD